MWYHYLVCLRDGAFERQTTGALALVLIPGLRLSRSLLLLLSRRRLGLRTSVRCGLSCRVLLGLAALQSLEVDLGNSLVEGFALGGSDLDLLLRRLARAVAVLLWR